MMMLDQWMNDASVLAHGKWFAFWFIIGTIVLAVDVVVMLREFYLLFFNRTHHPTDDGGFRVLFISNAMVLVGILCSL